MYNVKIERITKTGKTVLVEKEVGPDTSAKFRKPIGIDTDKVVKRHRDRSVDIIVVVHDDPTSASACIAAIRSFTIDRITVVDNASDEFTRIMLAEMKNNGMIHRLIRMNEHAGYLPALHVGFKETRGDWVVYVDQRVIVTNGWLDRMLEVIKERVAMVSPWSSKRIPPPMGCNYLDVAWRMSRLIGEESSQISFPGGFCLMVNRKLMNKIGGWDVEFYGPGYGEVADAYLRLLANKQIAVRANRAYVHDGSLGASEAVEWMPQDTPGYIRFKARWGKHATKTYQSRVGRDDIARIASGMLACESPSKSKVVFVFPGFELCGLTLSAVHLCNNLIEYGWGASVAFAKTVQGSSMRHFPMRFTPWVLGTEDGVVRGLRKSLDDAIVIATTWKTAKMVRDICAGNDRLRPVYYVQDDERKFVTPTGFPYGKKENIEKSYGMIKNLVANSGWVKNMLSGMGHDAERIGIGVDTLMFRPMERPTERIKVMAHCRPRTPRRGWPFIVAVVNRAARECDFEFITYDDKYEPDEIATPWHGSLGLLSPSELAMHMGTSHIFIEGSKRQGWGMQALEAMSCGCALISTDNGGIDNYGTHGHDCYVVKHGNVEGAARVLRDLVRSREARERVGANARETALAFDWSDIVVAWDWYLKDLRKQK